jgi:hypothetical protein
MKQPPLTARRDWPVWACSAVRIFVVASSKISWHAEASSSCSSVMSSWRRRGVPN